LAEGERRNKRSPDMRYQIAFYYQNKFGVSDQVEVLRCLYDLSCMPPSWRGADRDEEPAADEVDRREVRKVCAQLTPFARRLRGEDGNSQAKRAKEKLRAPAPEAIVRFLRHNKEVPSRYKGMTDELADADKQFPVLPPQFNEGPNEAHPAIATPDDYAPVVG